MVAPKNGEREGEGVSKEPEELANGMSHREVLDELKGLVFRAHDGDETAVPGLRKLLKEAPALARKFVDPADQVELKMLAAYAGEDLLLKEAMPVALKSMREELAGPDPSPLERLLVERVVATWFQLQYFEALHVQGFGQSMSLAQSDHAQKRVDRAQGRHLAAVKTLAQVRKSLGPAVQINIAEKQINTAGSG